MYHCPSILNRDSSDTEPISMKWRSLGVSIDEHHPLSTIAMILTNANLVVTMIPIQLHLITHALLNK